MTREREEAIKELEILKEDYWDDDGYGRETKQYNDTMSALDMAIQALEQESIIDKIKDEISHLAFKPYEGRDTLDRKDVLAILDKFREVE